MSKDSIIVDPIQIEVIRDWGRPTSTSEVVNFIGLAGYYNRFIKDFAMINVPMTILTRKEVSFLQSKECESSFWKCKDFFTLFPILTLYIEGKGYRVYHDAFGVCLGWVLRLHAKLLLLHRGSKKFMSITTPLMSWNWRQ